MHPVAVGVWAVFIAGILALEWFDPAMQHVGWWAAAVGYFALFEAIGGIRRHRGDMLSEGMWEFSSGKWGARAFTASFGIYFAERLYMLGAPEAFGTLPLWLPRATLLTGFGVWIAVHFYTEGRDA